MRKRRNKATIRPEEAIRFLDDLRKIQNQIDEPTVAISLRIPNNILRAIKMKAKTEGKKYQSLIVEFLRRSIQEK